MQATRPGTSQPHTPAPAPHSATSPGHRRAIARFLGRPGLFVAGLVVAVLGAAIAQTPALAAGVCVWAVGLGLAVAGSRPASAARTDAAADRAQDVPITRAEALTLGGVVLVGAAARLIRPEALPNGIHVDEAAMGLVARDILRGQGPHPFGFAFIGDPAPFMYAEALMMALFGANVGALRLLAGLVGAAGIASVWFLARPMFGRSVALLAAALVAVTASHVHFSRMALNIIEIPLFGVMAVACVWRGLRDGRAPWHVLAGICLGLSQFANFGARAFVLSVAGVYAVALLSEPRRWRTTIGGGLVALATMLAVVAPQLLFVRDDPGAMVDRLAFRSVFRRWDQATSIHQTDDPVWVMIGQARINLLAFVNQPDRGPFYEHAGDPLLSSLVAAVFLIGLGLAIVRVRDRRFSTLLWMCGGVLLAGVLSAGAPQFHRLLPMVPVACVLAAVGALSALRLVGRLFPRHAPRARARTAVVAATLLVIVTAADSAYALGVRHAQARPWQPTTAWARWVAAQPPDATVGLAGGFELGAWDERIKLLAGPRVVLDVLNPTVDLAPLRAGGRPFVLALSPRLDDWLPLLDHELPGATHDLVLGPDGKPLLIAIAVPGGAAAPDANRGLRGTIEIDEANGQAVPPRLDASLVFREASRLTDRQPFRARWTGTLAVERGGTYRFDAFTDGAVEVRIDGKSAASGRAAPNPRSVRGDVELTPGAHRIEVRYGYVRGPGTFELRWQPPGADRTVIPPGALRPE